VDSNIKIDTTVSEGYQGNSTREIRPSLKTAGVSVHLVTSCRNTATDGWRAVVHWGQVRDNFRRHVLEFAALIDCEWREA
jgi:hypothetical protein